MTQDANIRLERIERLLRELEYEITRGVMEREIEPDLSFQKLMPGGPTGEVGLSVYLRPIQRGEFFQGNATAGPKLRVVEKDADKD